MIGFIALGVWAFILYGALFKKLGDIEERFNMLEEEEDYE